MKKIVTTFAIASVALVIASCGGETPKTDLNQEEQAVVDSTVYNDQAAMDSAEKAIHAMIGADTSNAE